MARPGVTGLNHVTLAIGDLNRSVLFYRDLLGMELRAVWPEGAYLEAGPLWLCLSLDRNARTSPHLDYTHVAFTAATAEDFDALSDAIRSKAGIWRENKSEGPSLYFLDPDGHKLELHVGSLSTRLTEWRLHPRSDRTVFSTET